jgi:hypothetical protein
MNMQHGHEAWTCNKDRQHRQAVYYRHGHAVWTFKIDIQHGHCYFSRLRNTKTCSANDKLLIHLVCNLEKKFFKSANLADWRKRDLGLPLMQIHKLYSFRQSASFSLVR